MRFSVQFIFPGHWDWNILGILFGELNSAMVFYWSWSWSWSWNTCGPSPSLCRQSPDRRRLFGGYTHATSYSLAEQSFCGRPANRISRDKKWSYPDTSPPTRTSASIPLVPSAIAHLLVFNSVRSVPGIASTSCTVDHPASPKTTRSRSSPCRNSPQHPWTTTTTT